MDGSNKPILMMVGTRPEAIKMLPVYFVLKKEKLNVQLCSSGQHEELLNSVLSLFEIRPDYSLNIMKEKQDLFHITTTVLEKTKELFTKLKPSVILVQGDTTTAFASALAAFYLKIPIGHVEAGLRTSSIWDPYPEEVNRRFISTLTQYHFAPTPQSVANLLAERIDRNSIFLTGNTIVDALRIMKEKIENSLISVDAKIREIVLKIKEKKQSLILLTTHRRESFDGGIDNIFTAVKRCAQEFQNTVFFYPVHPNPHIQKSLNNVLLDKEKNIVLTDPITYQDLVYLLLNADWVATDSGGICEEAVSLGKRTLILRNDTERPEAIWSGLAELTGTETENIYRAMLKLLGRNFEVNNTASPFGNGYAAEKIVEIIKVQIITPVYDTKILPLMQKMI